MQAMEIQTITFGEKTAVYMSQSHPIGWLACQALQVPQNVLDALLPLCERIASVNTLIRTMSVDINVMNRARRAAQALFQLLGQYEPFTFMNTELSREQLDKVFTVDACKRLPAYYKAINAHRLTEAAQEQFRPTGELNLLAPSLANLYDALTLLHSRIGAFAEMLDADDAVRTKEAYLQAFRACFPEEIVLDDDNCWLSLSNVTMQYVAGQTENGLELQKHMHFVSFGDMLRTDFFEGLAVGHAPKRCANCSQWFLTMDARHTKYCSNVVESCGLTCRQIAAQKGRAFREKADDHPIKSTYERRMNTINHGVSRGSLSAELAKSMKLLAKSKMERALSDAAYAKENYEAEMEQEALKRAAGGMM